MSEILFGVMPFLSWAARTTGEKNMFSENMNTYVLSLMLSSISVIVATALLVYVGNVDIAIELCFWFFTAVAVLSSGLIFRDLADASQLLIKTNRKLTMWTWYNRKKVLLVALFSLGAVISIRVGEPEVLGLIPFIVICLLCLFFLFAGYINPKLMMRGRQDNGKLVSISEAKSHVDPDESVIVVEVNGQARAHADKQVLRPHVAGGKPLGGEDVVMTYCGLTNLGIAVTPEVNGERLNLQPMTQLYNNLVLVDEVSDEPIQQLWLKTESDMNSGSGNSMKQWPSFRMPFSKFEVAYPDGEVFLNDYKIGDIKSRFFENPFLALFDPIAEFIFEYTVKQQKEKDAPLFPSLIPTDKRLPSKEQVWAFNIGDDYVAYTPAFVRQQKSPINTKVGGRDVVIAYDEDFESLGVYYNNSGSSISMIDFFGDTPAGKMPRVETVKAGAYWIVWSHFFKETDINRI